ncbi:DUF3422 domain-containing protein [Rhodovulum sulfidophilum]|uniref:DUF3422 domain-containing protein n=3 Tax=Rhodovulum sulfidophilum TaxID=35806 RepID=A0ABS1RVZ5_RHOSU|nr:DUF3422 domain-containing protein [Rhodovulum sulfidophilum]ANB35317.1 hypothetical protein A6W98_15310 [Rhodovulum sulfidophilum DSM 1374]ANB39139.1 hypothetical protein A6024_15175 [Rhodovulum sulfidophilum]MBK5923067.1 hypothetical protein [Rhodovulum sulfidophilum]MBL3561038.1 DUF3422 domain-containing protein [Rhodovulum sulfidophilum]MBL3586891.1 DUF3422 domain-containing protein [Rhodovulum sulfidophilum]
MPIQDHPLRYALTNELHTRPFPSLQAPCHAAFLAIKPPLDAAIRDRDADRAHVIDLLDRFGAQHPKPGDTHFFGQMGRHKLKWESHTEFSTYTIFTPGVADRPFDPTAFEVFPDDWLETAPGARLTSALIRIEQISDGRAEICDRFGEWFAPDSLSAAAILDGAAVMATDFRIDTGGHMRMAIFVQPEIGQRRIGRIVQRLTEIETYKAMSMLGLPRARQINARLAELEPQLSALVGEMTGGQRQPEETLRNLLAVSAELESLLAQSAFRFSATTAYEALVHQRVEVLREERFQHRQTFQEFMMRRYDPSMRTVKASEAQLDSMTRRAVRAANLLRTQVDVERSAQNQKLLESMDRRADLQLRLQRTVEGLSVVAISYYAVSLVSYMIAPGAEALAVSKALATAVVTPVVVLAVWLMIRQLRKGMEH